MYFNPLRFHLLQVLELRLKLQTGEAAYAASEASQVLGRLIAVHGKAMAGQGATAAMGAAHWEQFQADLEWLRQHVAQVRGLADYATF